MTVCCRGGRGLHRGRHAGGRGDQAAGAGAGHGGEALQSDAASPQLRMRRTRRTPPARWTAWSPCSASRSGRAWRRRARRWRGCRRGCPPSSWGTRRTWCGPAACRLKVTSPVPSSRSVSSSPMCCSEARAVAAACDCKYVEVQCRSAGRGYL